MGPSLKSGTEAKAKVLRQPFLADSEKIKS
jgi:hypothetical protein